MKYFNVQCVRCLTTILYTVKFLYKLPNVIYFLHVSVYDICNIIIQETMLQGGYIVSVFGLDFQSPGSVQDLMIHYSPCVPSWQKKNNKKCHPSCQVGPGDPRGLGYTTQPSSKILIFNIMTLVFGLCFLCRIVEAVVVVLVAAASAASTAAAAEVA